MTRTEPAARTSDGGGQLTVSSARIPRLIGLATYVVGLLDIVTGLTHGLRAHLDLYNDIVPGAIGDAAAAATVVSGILLLLLAHALRRRKRRAWRAVLVLLLVSVGFHVVKGEPLAATLSLALVVLLWLNRREFNAAGDPRSRWLAVRAFVLLAAISMLLGITVIEIRRSALVGSPSLWTVTQHTFLGLFGITGPVLFGKDRDGDIVSAMLLGLGLMTALTTIYLALRPVRAAPAPHRPTTSAGCATCSAATACATPSASSPCAATRASCGPRAARPASPTGSSPA